MQVSSRRRPKSRLVGSSQLHSADLADSVRRGHEQRSAGTLEGVNRGIIIACQCRSYRTAGAAHELRGCWGEHEEDLEDSTRQDVHVEIRESLNWNCVDGILRDMVRDTRIPVGMYYIHCLYYLLCMARGKVHQ